MTKNRITSLVIALVTAVAVKWTDSASAAMQFFNQYTGQVSAELVGFGQASGPGATGNVTLSQLPAGAQILDAIVYWNDFAVPGGGGLATGSITDPNNTTTTFAAGQPIAPFSSDPVPIAQVFGYGTNVTGAITGPGQYAINIAAFPTFGSLAQVSGAGLLVIYSDPTLPPNINNRAVTVNHGVLMMGDTNPDSEMTTFTELPGFNNIGAGAGKLHLLTLADDPFSSSEQIKFNGQLIGGPIDGNLDPISQTSSIFSLNVTTLAGSGNNKVELTSQGDIFGWHLAVLESPIPEPSALAAVGVGLMMLLPRRQWYQRAGLRRAPPLRAG